MASYFAKQSAGEAKSKPQPRLSERKQMEITILASGCQNCVFLIVQINKQSAVGISAFQNALWEGRPAHAPAPDTTHLLSSGPGHLQELQNVILDCRAEIVGNISNSDQSQLTCCGK